MILSTLGISGQRMDYAMRHKKEGPTIFMATPDKRGNKTPKNKTPDEVIDNMKAHIRMFPRYRSHYAQKESAREYIDSNLTINKMYELY